MTSRSIKESRFIAAPEALLSSESEATEPSESHPQRRRHANVYDAVAGRITTTEALKNSTSRGSRSRRQSSSVRDTTLTPEEVLFQRRGAPQRYAEHDIYFANEQQLPDAGRDVLPDSDLLEAVHAYASSFYEAMARRHRTPGGGNDCFVGSRHVDERSMDETALLAVGILLEEAGREALGRRGDLVFTEGLVELDEPGPVGDEDEDEDKAAADGPRARRSGSRGGSSREASVGFEGEGEFWRRRLPKRRKVAADDEDG